MKTIKLNGIELLETIKRNQIEMNTKINVYYDDVFKTTLTFDGYNLNWEAGTFKVAYFYDGLCHFEIAEEKNIEPIIFCKKGDEYFIDTINELIDAVNELRKENK